MAEMGSRYNGGKTRFDFVCPIVMEAIAKVSMMGAAKYGDFNWVKGMSYSTSFNSLMRHLMSWWQGEELDPESQLPHIWHVLWNIQAIAEMQRRLGEGDPRLSVLDIDDRPYVKGPKTVEEAISGPLQKNSMDNVIAVPTMIGMSDEEYLAMVGREWAKHHDR